MFFLGLHDWRTGEAGELKAGSPVSIVQKHTNEVNWKLFDCRCVCDCKQWFVSIRPCDELAIRVYVPITNGPMSIGQPWRYGTTCRFIRIPRDTPKSNMVKGSLCLADIRLLNGFFRIPQDTSMSNLGPLASKNHRTPICSSSKYIDVKTLSMTLSTTNFKSQKFAA